MGDENKAVESDSPEAIAAGLWARARLPVMTSDEGAAWARDVADLIRPGFIMSREKALQRLKPGLVELPPAMLMSFGNDKVQQRREIATAVLAAVVTREGTETFEQERYEQVAKAVDYADRLMVVLDMKTDATADLIAACREEVAWFDDLQKNSHPDDDKLRAERARIHGPRIERARAAIAKAERGGA